MRNGRLLTAVVALMMLIAGCNTVQGLGKDIRKGGEVIEKSAK